MELSGLATKAAWVIFIIFVLQIAYIYAQIGELTLMLDKLYIKIFAQKVSNI